MQLITFLGLTVFIFLAIVGGILGIILEGQRIPAGSRAHNPATRDTMFPIVGWATLFAIYLLVEYVGAQNLTAGFKRQLGTLAVLPFFYAVLATGWLIWRAARRIHARLLQREPVAWRTIPYLGALRFPILSVSAALAAATEWYYARFSISFFLLASIVVLLALLRRTPHL
jgi:hypothetical protein